MKVGIVVEGMCEQHVAPIILGWLGVNFREQISRAEGVEDLLHQARYYADWQLSKGATHVAFFFDADGPDSSGRIEQLKRRLESAPSGRKEEGSFFFVPVHSIENWLLADEEALSSVLGERIERQNELESPGAVQRLDALFARVSASYRKTHHARLIAQVSRDRHWARVPSYQRATAPLRQLG